MRGGAFATKGALQRRAKRRRAAREREQWIINLMEGWGYGRAEAAAYIDDPANETLCDVCGWTMGMICPECSKGCGCEYHCSGWRHREFVSDDDDTYDDQTECEGCGAGNEYECVCGDEGTPYEIYGSESERDYWQEYKDDSMQPPMEEPPDDYYDEVTA